MIGWRNFPYGSTGNIYWPGASAKQVLALADSRYASHSLKAADEHTISCPINGAITYIPIPTAQAPTLAGLLTVEFGQLVPKGQQYIVVVRRLSTRIIEEIPVLRI